MGEDGGESSKSYFKFRIHFKMVEDFGDWEILYFCTIMYHISEKSGWEIIFPNFTSAYSKLNLC